LRNSSSVLVHLSLALLVLIWGTTWAAIRLGLEGVPPFTGVAIRMAIAAAILLTAGAMLRLRLGRERRERWLWLVNGVLSFFVSYSIVYWAEQWIPSGLAAVLFATFPLFTAILAHWLLPTERLTGAMALGILVAFAGVATIYSQDFALLGGRQMALAAVVFLISPLVSAIANVIVKRWGSGIHPVSLTGVSFAIGATLLGLAAGIAERGRPVRFDALSMGCILYLAVFGSAIAFALYFWLLQKLPATRLALVAYATPVIAVVVGVLFLDEPFTMRLVVGSAAVIVGVAIAATARGRCAVDQAGASPSRWREETGSST
jgi:drug/metabolite transporter (DMT)-like permease